MSLILKVLYLLPIQHDFHVHFMSFYLAEFNYLGQKYFGSSCKGMPPRKEALSCTCEPVLLCPRPAHPIRALDSLTCEIEIQVASTKLTGLKQKITEHHL